MYIKIKKKINPTKIKIESFEKRKYQQSNNSLNSNELENKNDSKGKEDEQEEDDQEQEKDNNDYNLQSIINKKSNIQEEINKSPPSTKYFSKIKIINKVKIKDNDNYFFVPKSYNTIDKNERRYFLEYNEEQKEIMKKINNCYYCKKDKHEQKSQENIVDCNIININFKKDLNRRNNKALTRNNLFLSKDSKLTKGNQIRNTISEIGMKIAPAFGRTTYCFYNKKDLIGNSCNFGNRNNGKINSLKNSINMALLSSIKQKMNFNDETNNF